MEEGWNLLLVGEGARGACISEEEVRKSFELSYERRCMNERGPILLVQAVVVVWPRSSAAFSPRLRLVRVVRRNVVVQDQTPIPNVQ